MKKSRQGRKNKMENDIKLDDPALFVVFIAFFSMVLFALSAFYFYLENIPIRNTFLIFSIIYLGLAIFGEFIILYQRDDEN